MTIISHALRVVYQPVPKNACSSVKAMLFEAESGRPADSLRDPDGNPVNVHSLYPTQLKRMHIPGGLEDYPVFAVLRDPLERFASGYRHRIVEKRDIADAAAQYPAIRDALEGQGLPEMPDPEFFAHHVTDYIRIVAMVRHHFWPQTNYLGNDPARLTLAVGPDGLDRIAELLSERAGRPIAVPHLRRSRVEETVTLSQSGRTHLKRFYGPDYKLLRALTPHLITSD